MIAPVMSELSSRIASTDAVVAVSGRSPWTKGIPISGTVDTIAAASTSSAAQVIFAANATNSGAALILVPAQATYMEVGAWGDGSSIGTDPIVELWRAHGQLSLNNSAAILGDPGIWTRLFNLLGSSSITFDGTETDSVGAANASRYVIPESTYQQFLLDVRGARAVIAKLTTIGSSNNWSLWHRFF